MKKSLKMLRAAVLVSAVAVGGAFAQVKPQLPEPENYTPPAGSPVAKHGKLKAGLAGTKGAVLDKDNNPVTLRGMSFFWANAGDGGGMYYNDDVVGWLVHDWKVSVLRAAIGVSNSDGNVGMGYADGAAANMMRYAEAVIEGCILRGAYVIVDWHTHRTDYQSNGVDFFGKIATKYGKYPNVLYEPFNEPTCNSCFSQVASYVNPMIAEIRKNSDNLVIVGNSFYSQNPNEGKNPGGIVDSKNNTAYTFHFYNNHSGLRGNATNARDNGLAVFVTEFGTVSSDGGNDNGRCPESPSTRDCHDLTVPDDISSYTTTWFTGLLEPNNISWVNWAVTHKNEGASVLKTSGTTGQWPASQLTKTGTYIRNQIRTYNASYYPNATYSVNATAGAGGSVRKTVGGAVSNGPYAYGTEVTVTAVPESGWEFQAWSGDASGGAVTLLTNVKGVDMNLSAAFYNGGLVKNGHFTQNTDSWNSNSAANLVVTTDNGQLKADVKNAGTATDYVRVTQTGLRLEAGRKYVLTFKARGQSARSVIPRLTNGTTTKDFLGKTPVSLKTTDSTFTVETPDAVDATITNAVLRFDCGNEAVAWYLDDVKLKDKEGSTAALPAASSAPKPASWSVAKAGGALQLRGPVEAGARVSLYDTRGKVVKSMAAKDGLTLNATGLPAGSYFVVVKNRAGADVYRSKVSFVR